MDDGLVKNTLAFRFPMGAIAPTLVEVARFVKDLDADLDTIETTYKISEDRCVCVKFKSHDAMQDALTQNSEIQIFQYSKGERVEIKMTVAGNITKYVRIFDLPPEIPDSEISAALSKYGIVKRMVREKFPADLGLNMFTGVRGVYLEIKREVPAILHIRNRKGRVYYEGLKQKCFRCKEEGHMKVNCPQKGNKTVASRLDNSTIDQLGSRSSDMLTQENFERREVEQPSAPLELPSYSAVVSGSKPQNIQGKMVKLVSDRNKTASSLSTAEGGEQMDTVELGAGKSAVKRQHSAGDSGDTDEDFLPGFTKGEANRKSSRMLKKVMTPLEVISSGPKKSDKNKRSCSK